MHLHYTVEILVSEKENKVKKTELIRTALIFIKIKNLSK